MIESPDHYNLKYSSSVCFLPGKGWVYIGDVDGDGNCVMNYYNKSTKRVRSDVGSCRDIIYTRPSPSWKIIFNGDMLILKRKLAKQFRVGISRQNHSAKYSPFGGRDEIDVTATVRILNEEDMMYSHLHRTILDGHGMRGVLSPNISVDQHDVVFWRWTPVGNMVKKTLLVKEAVFQEVKDVIQLPFYKGDLKVGKL